MKKDSDWEKWIRRRWGTVDPYATDVTNKLAYEAFRAGKRSAERSKKKGKP